MGETKTAPSGERCVVLNGDVEHAINHRFAGYWAVALLSIRR
jgi:hypothetical protein